MNNPEMRNNARQHQKIQVDIWSDIVCPFCYIGKRHFEQALERTGLGDAADVTWHSFELDPNAETNPGVSVYDDLARRKGWSTEQTKRITAQVTEKAKEAGLLFDFDNAIPANSRNAHRLLHLAKKYQVQDEVKELLLKGYFTDGTNIDDKAFLTKTGKAAGLTEREILGCLESEDINLEIERDIENARKIGIQGVPFFVIDGKYAVSGAQPVEVFVQAMEKVKTEAGIKSAEGSKEAFCTPDGSC